MSIPEPLNRGARIAICHGEVSLATREKRSPIHPSVDSQKPMERDTKEERKRVDMPSSSLRLLFSFFLCLTVRHLYAFKTPCGVFQIVDVDACRFSVRGFLRHVDEAEARRLASNYTDTALPSAGREIASWRWLLSIPVFCVASWHRLIRARFLRSTKSHLAVSLLSSLFSFAASYSQTQGCAGSDPS